MVLVPALPPDSDQTNLLQYREMLGNRLPAEGQLMLHGQPGADLEQTLAVALCQFVEDEPTGGGRQGFEEINHGFSIGK